MHEKKLKVLKEHILLVIKECNIKPTDGNLYLRVSYNLLKDMNWVGENIIFPTSEEKHLSFNRKDNYRFRIDCYVENNLKYSYGTPIPITEFECNLKENK